MHEPETREPSGQEILEPWPDTLPTYDDGLGDMRQGHSGYHEAASAVESAQWELLAATEDYATSMEG